ncbi:MAG TPA: septum site-determining protein MinC [Candidatus Binatia bacterium]|nr:septum site-determining protein MinC [Candidatus Binatia bacterium]
MTLLRGRRDGIEVALGNRDLEAALAELEARLAEQPTFYSGSPAVANFGATLPTEADLVRLRDLLAAAGVTLLAVSGVAEGLRQLAEAVGTAFEQPAPPAEIPLSDAARSLVADFAGARNEIAERRRRGEASVRRAKLDPPKSPAPVAELRLVDAPPGTLYHAATLRGGQVLHNTGNIVVVGDVNPGAELIATGDIVVFGRLAGIAHAGARGDENARIYALELAATQLRIASFIAADERAKRRSGAIPEAAVARDGRIVILSLERLARLETSGAAPA